MPALSFDILILGGATSCVPHQSSDSAVTAIRSVSRRDRGGSTGTLRFVARFPSYGPVFFVCAFDAVFELVPVVEKLLIFRRPAA